MHARRHERAFPGCAPLAISVPPQARIVPRKKVTGPVLLECTLEPVPPKILFVPPPPQA